VAAVDREDEGQKNNEKAQINEHNGGKYLTCFQQKRKLFLRRRIPKPTRSD
jgi:hypothetical protein